MEQGPYKLYSTGHPESDYLMLFAEEDANPDEYIFAIKFDYGLSIYHNATAEVDSYTSDSREWISASGVLNGSNITIDGAVNSVSIIDAPESLNLSALNGHKVTVYGYFDGAPMVGGTRKFDPVQLIITVTNGSETVEMDPIGHNFVNSVDKLEWLHADVVLEGVSITKDTRITIKSDAWGETAATSGSSVYRRWFIDNIKLSRAN